MASESQQNLEDGIKFSESRRKSKLFLFGIIALVAIVIIIVIVVVAVTLSRKADKSSGSVKGDDAKPTNITILPLPTGPPDSGGPYRHAVVAADAGQCSEIGRDIMHKKNGSAVDGAVAALFCIGIINMHSAGIGGGGFITVYNRSSMSAEVFDFREEAPGASNTTMYINSSLSSTVGASAVAVPGEVKGFHAAWMKYGRLPWKQLVQPAIDLAANGFPLGAHLYYAMTRKSVKKLIMDPKMGISEILVNEKGELRQLGELIKLPKLANTLKRIRDDPESFYKGDLARDIVRDIQSNGGIITLDDMANYKVKVKKPLESTLGKYHWYSVPPPGSGAILGLILNILQGYNFTAADRHGDANSTLTYHRIVEAFKFAYAYRALLGDEDFYDLKETLANITNPAFAESLRQKILDNQTFTNFSHYGNFFSTPDDAGTSHLSLLAPNGDAVSATTTINLYFGSKFRSTSTGIIFNNEMDDFSTPGKPNAYGIPPSAANFIVPRKRPLSSTAPSVFRDDSGEARIVAGASGGTKITTAISLAVMNYLWFNRTLSQSIVDPRLHHQLMPMYIRVDREWPVPQAILDGLERLGHTVKLVSGSAVVQAVAKGEDGLLYGKSDPRKYSWAAGF
ncbi:glutathione hydrolase 1 proenzyme isoform X2 [Nematostella vectensis]|uniref:glutathione hydrolase 1 proenzyme isoform X2 n=1 Tax=Nematostella vectensis TaxID=45351 RepID=UPI0020770EA4|nr:glutathione hydrolase 1 proenzyme isoform X2 [Nematostella vectensis]